MRGEQAPDVTRRTGTSGVSVRGAAAVAHDRGRVSDAVRRPGPTGVGAVATRLPSMLALALWQAADIARPSGPSSVVAVAPRPADARASCPRTGGVRAAGPAPLPSVRTAAEVAHVH